MNTQDALTHLRDFFGQPDPAEEWDTLATFIDTLDAEALQLSIEYAREHMKSWPRHAAWRYTSVNDFLKRPPKHWPLLSRLQLSDYFRDAEGRKALKKLGASSYSANLRHLDFSQNIDPKGFKVLMDSPLAARLESLEFDTCEVGTKGLKTLLKKVDNLCELIIMSDHDGIGPKGAQILAQHPGSQRLELLDLGWDPHGGIQTGGLRALAESPHMCNLSVLSLEEHELGDSGAAVIAKSPNFARLKRLCLTRTGITSQGATALSRSQHLQALQELELNSNEIKPNAILALMTSKQLTSLRTLRVSNNFMGPKERKKLQKMAAKHNIALHT